MPLVVFLRNKKEQLKDKKRERENQASRGRKTRGVQKLVAARGQDKRCGGVAHKQG